MTRLRLWRSLSFMGLWLALTAATWQVAGSPPLGSWGEALALLSIIALAVTFAFGYGKLSNKVEALDAKPKTDELPTAAEIQLLVREMHDTARLLKDTSEDVFRYVESAARGQSEPGRGLLRRDHERSADTG